MARYSSVRTGTLKKHAKEALIESIEIVVGDQGASVYVHYNDRARGTKTRVLTAYHTEGEKRYASIDSIWKLAQSLGLHEMVVRDEHAHRKKYKPSMF